MKYYNVYKQRKEGPPYFVETYRSWFAAKRGCRIYNKILKMNGYADKCKFFCKKQKVRET